MPKLPYNCLPSNQQQQLLLPESRIHSELMRKRCFVCLFLLILLLPLSLSTDELTCTLTWPHSRPTSTAQHQQTLFFLSLALFLVGSLSNDNCPFSAISQNR